MTKCICIYTLLYFSFSPVHLLMMFRTKDVRIGNQNFMKETTRDRVLEDVVLASDLREHQMVIKMDMTEENVV